MTAIQRLEIEKEQAERLADAIKGCGGSIAVPAFVTKYGPWLLLVWVSARIYVPMARDVAAGQTGPKNAARVAQQAPAQPVVTVPAPPAANPAVLPSPRDEIEEWIPTPGLAH